jgi:outer membrane immunogenic protein
MKNLTTCAVAIAALIAAPVFAADMLTKAPPPAPVPATSWSGFYVGANGGYGWDGDPTVSYTANDPVVHFATCSGAAGTTCLSPTTFGVHGGLGGIQAGYNWQPDRRWLVGLESDFDWSAIRGSGTSNYLINAVGGPAPAAVRAAENVKWFGTVRTRLGWLPTDSFLVYGTGGLAYGRVDASTVLTSSALTAAGSAMFGFACTPGVACFVGNTSRTLTGYGAGAGGAFAISSNVTLFAEYLYVNLGHISVNTVGAPTGVAGQAPSSFTANFSSVVFNVVRAGLNYKF